MHVGTPSVRVILQRPLITAASLPIYGVTNPCIILVDVVIDHCGFLRRIVCQAAQTFGLSP